MVVDGYTGQVYAQLSDAMRGEFVRAIDDRRRENAALESIRHLDAVTADGQRATLCVNAGLSADVEVAVRAGASGIGLYRSGCRSCCSIACRVSANKPSCTARYCRQCIRFR